MKYYELVDRIHSEFYQNFTINKDEQYYNVQSKLLTSAIVLMIMEKTLGNNDPEVKIAKNGISSTIDKVVFESQELMRRARITEATKQFPFAFLEIYKIKNQLEVIHKAIEEGSLTSALSQFSELLYVTYVKPMNKHDNENYMKDHPFEFLRLKSIFLMDYFSFKKIVETSFIEQQITDKN